MFVNFINFFFQILMEENALMVEQKSKLSITLDELQDELNARTQELSTVVQHLTSTERDVQVLTARLTQAEKDRYLLRTIFYFYFSFHLHFFFILNFIFSFYDFF